MFPVDNRKKVSCKNIIKAKVFKCLETGKNYDKWGKERIVWMDNLTDTITKINKVDLEKVKKAEPTFTPLKEVFFLKKLGKLETEFDKLSVETSLDNSIELNETSNEVKTNEKINFKTKIIYPIQNINSESNDIKIDIDFVDTLSNEMLTPRNETQKQSPRYNDTTPLEKKNFFGIFKKSHDVQKRRSKVLDEILLFTHLKTKSSHSPVVENEKTEKRRRGILLYDYINDNEDEISLLVDEMVYIVEIKDNGWTKIESRGKFGEIPSEYVSEIEEGIINEVEYDESLKNEMKIRKKKKELRESSFTFDIKQYYENYEKLIEKKEEEIKIEADTIYESKLLKLATINQVFELLTDYNNNIDIELLNIFLFSYRSFMKPNELMEKLKNKYNTLKKDENMKEIEFVNTILIPTRLKIIQMINTWIIKYYYDIDEYILNEINGMIQMMNNTKGEADSKILINSMNEVKGLLNNKKIIHNNNMNIPKSILTKTKIENNMFMYSIIELARQLTIFEFEFMYKNLTIGDFLDVKLSKKNPHNMLSKITQWFDIFSSTISNMIVSESNIKNRVELLELSINMAVECQKLNNHNSVYEIVTGISNAAVSRMKKTWEGVSQENMKKYNNLLNYLDKNKNNNYLRNIQTYKNTALLPYL
jgi:hypothetical protein